MSEPAIINRPGRDRLWRWFSLSYASFCVLPRVLMHEMPDEWQEKMAVLLEEFDEAFNQPNVGKVYISLRRYGKFTALPEWMKNYRHPDRETIEGMRRRSP